MAIIAGIDYSMNSPAIAVWNSNDPMDFAHVRFYNFSKTKRLEGMHGVGNVSIMIQREHETNEPRFRAIAAWSKAVLSMEGVTDAALEGYAMNSKNSNNLCQTAENCGLLKQQLYTLGIDFEVYAPNEVKMAFSGKGNADKDLMIETFTSFMKHDLVKSMDITAKAKKPVDDIADSYAILRMHSKTKELLGDFRNGK